MAQCFDCRSLRKDRPTEGVLSRPSRAVTWTRHFWKEDLDGKYIRIFGARRLEVDLEDDLELDTEYEQVRP
jgi:hypothetical protein